MITSSDLGELRRIATNTYDNDKRFVNRVIAGITQMEREINTLKAEIAMLKAQKGA